MYAAARAQTSPKNLSELDALNCCSYFNEKDRGGRVLACLIHEGAASGDCRRQIGPKMLVAA
jgi:hypothetical protein